MKNNALMPTPTATDLNPLYLPSTTMNNAMYSAEAT